MHGLARLIVLAAAALPASALPACKDAPTKSTPVQRPGVDGLVAFLDPQAEQRFWTGNCFAPYDVLRRITTPGYIDLMRLDVGAVMKEWPRIGPVHVRVLYADDQEVPASLRRSRVVLPVGRPPLVASIDGHWLSALFVFEDRWLCLGTIEGYVRASLPYECRVAYLGSSRGRCLDFTGALSAAIRDSDDAERERLCTLMVEHGCGSVPAEAPLPTEPVPKQ